MPRHTGAEVGGRRFIEALVAAAVLVGVLLGTCGCTADSETSQGDAAVEAVFDASSLSWDPAKLEAVTPMLVGWRGSDSGELAQLVTLPVSGSEDVLWEAPGSDVATMRIEDVDPAGTRMLGCAYETGDIGYLEHDLVFRADGSVDELPIPDGYDAMLDAGFLGEDLLVLVYHATNEEFSTTMGTVDAGNEWHEMTIEGEVPAYQFVESVAVLPGTDTVALILKTAGGTGDRDDDALVLAEREGSILRVSTTAYWDDSLPGCAPLWDGQGVLVGRSWSDADDGSTVFVRVEWTGTGWTEQVVTSPEEVPVLLERGGVMAQDASGTYWFRRITPGADGTASELVRVRAVGDMPEVPGIDATQIEWFTWVEGSGG